MQISTEKQLLIEQRITNDSKGVGVAYLLWFFFGFIGGHRFYLGRTKSAIFMLVLALTILGLIITAVWALIDAFLIPGMVDHERSMLRQQLTKDALSE